jgi:hypothetical protein
MTFYEEDCKFTACLTNCKIRRILIEISVGKARNMGEGGANSGYLMETSFARSSTTKQNHDKHCF